MADAASLASTWLAALQDNGGLAMLRQVVATARAAAHTDAVAILLHDQEHGRFVPTTPRVAVGLDERWLENHGLEAAQTLALRAVEAHEVLDIPDTAAVPKLDYPLLAGGLEPGAVCAAPVEVEGATVGVLELYDALPRAARLDTEMLRSFAALVGVAIVTTLEHERERSLRIRLEVLDAASKVVASELSLDRVLQHIVEAAAAAIGARYGALGVAGPDGYLTGFITTGLTLEERARLGHLPRGHGLLGLLIRQGEPLRVPDIGRDPRRIGFPSHHPQMRSLLGVPIRAHAELVGALYLTDKIRAPDFSDDDQRLVELLAAHAGIAIENAHLHTQVQQMTTLRERERTARDLYDGIIQDIYAATLQLANIAADVVDPAAPAQLLDITEHLSEVIDDIRAYIQGLQPWKPAVGMPPE